MTSFGFGKPAEKREKTIDKAGLPRGPIVVDPASERDAVARGEPRARAHLHLEARRDLEAQPGRHACASAPRSRA